MRIYEELFIVRSDVPEEEIDQLIEQTEQIITGGGGTVDKVEKWGVRKLAYRVRKREDGFYVLVQFTSGPEVVKEIERRFRVSDLVMKYLTVRIDERLKRIEKRRKQREKRAKRKPAPVAAPPAAAPSAPAPAPASPTPGQPEAPAEEPVTAEPAAEGAEKEQ